jgi:hypothetical protein
MNRTHVVEESLADEVSGVDLTIFAAWWSWCDQRMVFASD